MSPATVCRVAELRPLRRRRRVTAEELIARHRKLAKGDFARIPHEADEFFGGEDGLDDEDAARPARD